MSSTNETSRLLKIATYTGLFIGVLANIGGILGIFGITGSRQLGIIVFVTGLFVLGFTLLIRYILNLRTASRSQIYLARIAALEALDLKHAKELYILGSGTETWFTCIAEIYGREGLRDGIKINVGFRVGQNPDRHAKLLTNWDKWRRLAKKHRLELKFYPYDDFFFMMRGIVVDRDTGIIGFYHRVNDETIGAEQSLMFVRSDSKVGKYLIDNFLKIFTGLQSHDTILDVLTASQNAAISKNSVEDGGI